MIANQERKLTIAHTKTKTKQNNQQPRGATFNNESTTIERAVAEAARGMRGGGGLELFLLAKSSP